MFENVRTVRRRNRHREPKRPRFVRPVSVSFCPIRVYDGYLGIPRHVEMSRGTPAYVRTLRSARRASEEREELGYGAVFVVARRRRIARPIFTSP